MSEHLHDILRTMDRSTVPGLVEEFRATLLDMHECRTSDGGDPRRWNHLVDKVQSVHLRLREVEEGRDAIAALMEDDCLTVRQWAAANALAWAPGAARAELERQAASAGLYAFEARVTLREFDAGRLNTTWRPKQ